MSCVMPFSAQATAIEPETASVKVLMFLGQKFAMMELKVILATLLRTFQIESTQKQSELRPNPGLVLQPSNGITVKLTSR